MNELPKEWGNTPFPDLIRNLPEVDIPFEGIHGWLLQGETIQAIFLDIQPIGEVPMHSHGAQWGIVLEGEMDLTIGGETKTRRKGDWYYIPAGVQHGATFRTRVQVIDIFADVHRYRAK